MAWGVTGDPAPQIKVTPSRAVITPPPLGGVDLLVGGVFFADVRFRGGNFACGGGCLGGVIRLWGGSDFVIKAV